MVCGACSPIIMQGGLTHKYSCRLSTVIYVGTDYVIEKVKSSPLLFLLAQLSADEILSRGGNILIQSDHIISSINC